MKPIMKKIFLSEKDVFQRLLVGESVFYKSSDVYHIEYHIFDNTLMSRESVNNQTWVIANPSFNFFLMHKKFFIERPLFSTKLEFGPMSKTSIVTLYDLLKTYIPSDIYDDIVSRVEVTYSCEDCVLLEPKDAVIELVLGSKLFDEDSFNTYYIDDKNRLAKKPTYESLIGVSTSNDFYTNILNGQVRLYKKSTIIGHWRITLEGQKLINVGEPRFANKHVTFTINELE